MLRFTPNLPTFFVVIATLAALATVVLAAPVPQTAEPTPSVLLADFSGKATHAWHLVNDPVMGGVSKSTFTTTNNTMKWQGEVRIVPKLDAPGFCNLESSLGRYPSAQGTTHLMLKVRTSSPEYTGFKVSVAAHTLNPQFKSYKTNFAASSDWEVVSLPWTAFSNDWSPFTGDCDTKDPTGKQHHCCSQDHPEVCPKDSYLAKISQLGLWTEGKAGNFTLEVAWIGAGSPIDDTEPLASAADEDSDHKLVCQVQKSLRYNVGDLLVDDFLPFGSLPNETLAEAICCDKFFETFAEPYGFFDGPGIDLAKHMSSDSPTTFYDSACGLPVFKAPIGRSLDEFLAESREHGWPSFRSAELVAENVVISPNGTVHGRCGSHLGDLMPDDKGDRFCIDLVSIAGNPQ